MSSRKRRALPFPFSMLCALSIAAALFVFPIDAAGQQALREKARIEIEQLIAKSGGEVSIAFRTLDGKMEFYFDAEKQYHAASTMKVPVMIELFAQAQAGKLKLEDEIPVVNEFHSIVDGSGFQLDAADDSDPEIYKAIGQTRTLRRLCEAMISVSSNLATNLLMEKLGIENIRQRVRTLGGDGMNVLRCLEDAKAFQEGKNNTTNAIGLMRLMEKIANGEAGDAAATREMIEILKKQKFVNAIPAGVPKGVPVGNKTGWITKIHHDAAIVFALRPLVLVILTRGIADEKKSAMLIADITRVLYQASQ